VYAVLILSIILIAFDEMLTQGGGKEATGRDQRRNEG
jgi:hypothetical protein